MDTLGKRVTLERGAVVEDTGPGPNEFTRTCVVVAGPETGRRLVVLRRIIAELPYTYERSKL